MKARACVIILVALWWPAVSAAAQNNPAAAIPESILLWDKRGIQFLRAHASKFKIAPDCIGVIGFSAGAANICGATFQAHAGTSDAADPVERVSSSPNFMVPIYGASPLPDQVSAPLPPTFMFCTGEDAGALGGMLTLFTNLRKRGVPTEVQ